VSEQPANCASCGAPLPAEAKFCPSCGAGIEGDATVRADVPPHETSGAPVTVTRVTPRWFGVAPATLVFAVAAVTLVAGIVLLVTGALVAGLLLLGLALLLFAAFLEVARRKPDAPVARRAAGAADSFRARAGFAAQALRTRSSARRAITHRRAQALQLQGERDRLLRSLGESVYRGEDDSALREQIAAVEARQAALQAEAEEIAERAHQEVERASRAVQPTEVRPPGDG
jgi:zinc-ribbon domain